MKDKKDTQPPLQNAQPDPALKRLEPLIGTWNMTGHTLDSKEDNITGWNTFKWILSGFFMESSGEIDFMGFKLQSLEILRYDPASDTFASTSYSSMSGDVLPYGWDVRGNIVTHWDKTSKFTGTLRADGKTLTGGWRPNTGESQHDGNAYDVVMTKTK